ncbi:MAG: GNAT family N-acetyltransferase [Pseudomonadota bacterium]
MGELTVRICEDFEPVRASWLALELHAIGSVYQRFAWVSSWAKHAAKPARMIPRIVLISHGDEPVAVLPLAIRQRGPFKMATWLADSHSNFHMGLYSSQFLQNIKPDDVRELLPFILKQFGKLDVLELCCQPVMWQGHTNPFTFLKWQESHNHAFALNLLPDFNSALDRKNGARKRKKFRWQNNKLKEHDGPHLRVAETPDDVRRMLSAATEQLKHRFDRAGIWNRFYDEGVMPFFEALAIEELGKAEPALKLFALEIDGEIQATFAGGINSRQFSGCFISVADGEFSRLSPGELMIYLVIKDCVDAGLEVFDLGRGEERYKTSWCDTTMPMFETTIALSKRAAGFAAYERGKTATKRFVRNNERLWGLAKKVRSRLYGRV